MSEKDYGGAFDIDPHSFWTRDDIDELVSAIEDTLQLGADKSLTPLIINESYISNDNIVEICFTHQDTSYTVKQKIDMRKIQSPNDLNKKYVSVIAEQILQVIS